jgi:hypothetical protein
MTSQFEPGAIVAAFVYSNDVIVVRRGKTGHGPPWGRTDRSITRFSPRSYRHLCFVANNTSTNWQSMAVVTYPADFPSNGKLVKCHLNKLLGWLRYHYADVHYLWFLEFQKRGAPHVHILTDIRLSGCRDVRHASRAKLAKRWYDIVGSNDIDHRLAGTSWDNEKKTNGLRRYVAKYAAKRSQKTVPPGYTDVGRFWGKSRNVQCPIVKAIALDETELRRRLRNWSHLPSIDNFVWRMLYNASLDIDIDIS